MSILLSFGIVLICVAVNRKRQRDHARIQESLRDFARGEQGKGVEQSCINWDAMRGRQ